VFRLEDGANFRTHNFHGQRVYYLSSDRPSISERVGSLLWVTLDVHRHYRSGSIKDLAIMKLDPFPHVEAPAVGCHLLPAGESRKGYQFLGVFSYPANQVSHIFPVDGAVL
jgi:hypothetical protein